MQAIVTVVGLSLLAGLGTGLGGLAAVVGRPRHKLSGLLMGHQHFTAMGIIMGAVLMLVLAGVLGL